jgi:hypothetical protein
MADIGAVRKRRAVAERAIATGWIFGLVLTAQAAQPAIGAAFPLPRNNVGRRIADWAVGAMEAVRAIAWTPTRRSEPKKRRYHPHRESFIEDAAMSREMYRL